MKIKKVALFGDSILRGVILDDNNKYCFSKNIDWQFIENTLNVSIINKSRFGCEIVKGQKIVNDFLLASDDIDVAVIEYGGNDSDFMWNEIALNPMSQHTSKTGIVEFEQKLRTLVLQLKAKGIMVVMMILPPLAAQRYLNWGA